jgi:arylsulfatase A-like enzyme
MKEIGLVPPETALSPAPDDWASVPDKAWEARCKEVYAAMVETMDVGIGRIVARLKSSAQLDNTLILDVLPWAAGGRQIPPRARASGST